MATKQAMINYSKNGPFDEMWKDILGYDFKYQISNKGNIKMADGHTTKGYINEDGYFKINFRKNKKNITKLVHRLVAEYFIPNPENKPEIDHIDTNKLNNNYKNLRWSTRTEQFENETTKDNIRHRVHPKNRPVKCIETGEIFTCTREAARKYRLGNCAISNAANPNNRLKSAGGYHWQYVEE